MDPGKSGQAAPVRFQAAPAFAHRGGGAEWPENTLEAFAGCQALGDFVIETDARVTSDQHVVLFHDAHLERTTNGFGPLASRSLAQLHSLDAAYWWGYERGWPQRGRGMKIPTLLEALERFPSARFNVELKPGCAAAPRLVWDDLRKANATDRCIIASAQHRLLAEFRELSAGQVSTSATRRELLELAFRLRIGALTGWRPRYVALQIPRAAYGIRLFTPQLVVAARERGIQTHVWTVNSRSEMHDLFDAGADGIMTDCPTLLAQVLRERS